MGDHYNVTAGCLSRSIFRLGDEARATPITCEATRANLHVYIYVGPLGSHAYKDNRVVLGDGPLGATLSFQASPSWT